MFTFSLYETNQGILRVCEPPLPEEPRNRWPVPGPLRGEGEREGEEPDPDAGARWRQQGEDPRLPAREGKLRRNGKETVSAEEADPGVQRFLQILQKKVFFTMIKIILWFVKWGVEKYFKKKLYY